jgi:DNA-directed RNA polymerase, delta subunit
MKNFFLFFVVLLLVAAVSCSSSKKDGTAVIDDSDYDTDDDNDIAEVDENDDDESDTDDNDEHDADTDDDKDKVPEDPCSKNPCKNIENSTGECVSEEEEYSCKCKENYTWEGYAWEGARCKADERKENCTGLPENAQWTKVSEVTQTWNGEEWEPSATAVYSEETSYNRCYFKCLPAYLWDGEKCAEPCENEPCKDIPNATGTCFNSTAGRYICECDENYWWWGERRGCIAQKPALANICTGMYSCYNNGGEIECPAENDEVFYGQDAQYAKLGFCSPKDFTVNSDFPDEPTIVNRNTGLEWHHLPEYTSYSWNEAAEICGNLSYAGKNDWRLPKLHELMSIAPVTNEDKELNEIYFPLQESAVWASEIFHYNNQPWSLSISSGTTSSLFNNYNQRAAVCVRGDESPAPVFEESTVNGDKVLTDSASGLMWQKNYTDKGMTKWKEALFYCENLIYAGYSDWRLPNRNELASIINYEKYRPATDFPITPMHDMLVFFSATSQGGMVNIVDFVYGELKMMSKGEGDVIPEYFARCVRSDVCEEGYFLKGSECVKNPCKPESCDMPSSTGACLPETESAYKCECAEGYSWNGSQCVNPCDSDPCSKIANSDKVCTPVNATIYYCGCLEGFSWNDGGCNKVATAPTLGNICSGQQSCYSMEDVIQCPAEGKDFYGQDAQYAAKGKCKQQSLVLKTVSDETIVIDKNTELQWQQTISKKAYTWNDAFAYCENLEYAGFSDWRMPAPQEIMTIVLYSGSSTSINTGYFTDIPVSGSGNYLWTSAFYKNDPERVWIFHPNKGFIYYLATKSSIYNVMCVRGKGLPAANFEISSVSGDSIAKDYSSGLVWQKTYTEIETWQEALAYCENLEYAGFSDWRLPNKNELTSIINYDSDNDSWPLDMPWDYGFWTSTTFFSSSMTNELAIVIEPDDSQDYMPKHNKFYHYPYHVRCVR